MGKEKAPAKGRELTRYGLLNSASGEGAPSPFDLRWVTLKYHERLPYPER